MEKIHKSMYVKNIIIVSIAIIIGSIGLFTLSGCASSNTWSYVGTIGAAIAVDGNKNQVNITFNNTNSSAMFRISQVMMDGTTYSPNDNGYYENDPFTLLWEDFDKNSEDSPIIDENQEISVTITMNDGSSLPKQIALVTTNFYSNKNASDNKQDLDDNKTDNLVFTYQTKFYKFVLLDIRRYKYIN